MEEEHSLTAENAELIEKLQETSLKHKKEMDEIIEQNNLDREDWDHERQQAGFSLLKRKSSPPESSQVQLFV
ncbi:hypothetical protein OESDEN_24884 [Oesophagostomum dentatum]|uniref:Uncharacterized protein n=1 Tax=Oesophagostomum dentatum TaxID=61180 RepID=A0A0B1RWR2_OESDE|nr:hypothetical protein OESDEN_24884 [Oesophagostomum dentatum]